MFSYEIPNSDFEVLNFLKVADTWPCGANLDFEVLNFLKVADTWPCGAGRLGGGGEQLAGMSLED